MNLYQEHILDHYKNPRNKGTIERPDLYFKDNNPLCGDEIAVYASVSREKITAMKYMARGCAISQAAASILSEEILGKDLSIISKMGHEDMQIMMMIPISAARIKCAALALKTLQAAIVRKKI